MVTVLGVFAAAWGLIMAISPVLQIRRMLARRSSDDISLGYLVVLLPGFGLWIAYGSARGDLALVIPNVVALTVGSVAVAVALKLRTGRVRPDGGPGRNGDAEATTGG